MALSPTDDNGAALRGHDRGDARRLRQRVAARGGGRAAAKSHSRVVFSFSVVIQRCHSALSFSIVIKPSSFSMRICVLCSFSSFECDSFSFGSIQFHSAISFSVVIQRFHSALSFRISITPSSFSMRFFALCFSHLSLCEIYSRGGRGNRVQYRPCLFLTFL